MELWQRMGPRRAVPILMFLLEMSGGLRLVVSKAYRW